MRHQDQQRLAYVLGTEASSRENLTLFFGVLPTVEAGIRPMVLGRRPGGFDELSSQNSPVRTWSTAQLAAFCNECPPTIAVLERLGSAQLATPRPFVPFVRLPHLTQCLRAMERHYDWIYGQGEVPMRLDMYCWLREWTREGVGRYGRFGVLGVANPNYNLTRLGG